MSYKIIYIPLIIIALFILSDIKTPAIPPAGITAPYPPLQNSINAKSFTKNGYTVTPVTTYEITARILGINTFKFSSAADISPIDFALGWGAMSDSAVFSKLSIVQGHRTAWWYTSDVSKLPVAEDQIKISFANTHLIPANNQIEQTLRSFSLYDVVTLKGFLVRIAKDDGWEWNTSVSREDYADGACEIMWVEEVARF